MKELIERITTCTNCELHESCRTPVPPSAPTIRPARFLVLGEGPGRQEDLLGRPFVGPAGERLRQEFRAINLDDKEVAYGNIVCCWPHGTPRSDHIEACLGNLQAQMRAIKPKYILLCGEVALKAFFPKAQIRYAAGTLIPFHSRFVYPVYHPSFILKTAPALDKTFSEQIRSFYFAASMEAMSGGRRNCIYCDTTKEEGTVYCFKHKKWWWAEQGHFYRQVKKSKNVNWEEFSLPGLEDV
jgi:uracil-DNA glycosylase